MSHPTTGKLSVAAAVDREAQYGTLPVLDSERQFGFWDTLFILGGYGIATWCYTQGAFQATLTNTPQLLTTIFAGNIFILAIYLLPLLFAARYGIDMWQWLKAIFGTKGIRIMVVAIIVVNFPWFGVNAMIFGSAMVHLMETMDGVIGHCHRRCGRAGRAAGDQMGQPVYGAIAGDCRHHHCDAGVFRRAAGCNSGLSAGCV